MAAGSNIKEIERIEKEIYTEVMKLQTFQDCANRVLPRIVEKVSIICDMTGRKSFKPDLEVKDLQKLVNGSKFESKKIIVRHPFDPKWQQKVNCEYFGETLNSVPHGFGRFELKSKVGE